METIHWSNFLAVRSFQEKVHYPIQLTGLWFNIINCFSCFLMKNNFLYLLTGFFYGFHTIVAKGIKLNSSSNNLLGKYQEEEKN